MRTTIDKAGRLVVPKALRDRLGLSPGEVEVTADGNALRVEAVPGDGVEERVGTAGDPPVRGARSATTTSVRIRDADRR